MKKALLSLFTLIALYACNDAKKEEPKAEPSVDLYKKYDLLKADELVIEAFQHSDIVTLGEYHFIRDHVSFVADLIPKLYENGVYILYSEFISVDYSPQINELINAEHFDEQKAKNLLMLNLWDWPYQEYMELYRSAWKLNKTITDGPKFRIIGLDRPHDYSAIQSPEDWDDPEKRKAFFVDWEDAWAERVLAETVEKGEKALVYCGVYHALTFYNQPILKDGEFYRFAERDRVGQYLYDELKDNCTFLTFHFPWDTRDGMEEVCINPLAGRLDEIVDSLGVDQKAYGFFTEQSLLGKVVDTNNYMAHGYPNFTLSDFCDGYIVVSPLCDLKVCQFIPDFIDSSNIEIVRPQIHSWEEIHNITIEDANQLLLEKYNDQQSFFDEGKRKMGCK